MAGGPFQSVSCRVPQWLPQVEMLSPSDPILTRRLGRPGYSGQTKIFLFNLPLVVYAFLARLNTTSEYERLFMFGLLGVLIIGLIVGAIAKLIVPGKEPGGCLITMAIGIAGSFVAFYLGSLLGWTSGNPDSLRPVGFIPSLIGAIILLLVYHWIRRRFGR